MRQPLLLIARCFLLLLRLPSISESTAQNVSTDPSEVKALNSIFSQWDVQPGVQWNLSGQPCSGSAISEPFCWNQDTNPCIKCNCSLGDGTACHITHLRVQKLDRRGGFLKELVALSYLTFLKIDKNYFSGPLPAFVGKLSLLEELTISHNAFSGTIPRELGNLKKLKMFGYLAPEYAMRGHLTEKADVFGFGVVALETLSGRPNFDRNLDDDRKYLLEWAWHLYENGRSMELLDPMLLGYNEEEARRLIRVGILCLQASPMMRPPMSRVVAMLVGDVEVSVIASKPGYLTDWDFQDTTISTSSRYDTTASSIEWP